MMDDLISRASVLNGISDLMKSPWYNDGKSGERHVQYLARKEAVDVVKVLCVVKEAAVNAVPVVRCKDCKHRPVDHRDEYNDVTGLSIEFPDYHCPCQCEDGWYNWYPEDYWFCANGERRDDDATLD